MSVSSEADPEGGQGSARVAGMAAWCGGEVDRPGAAEYTDRQVAQAGMTCGAVLVHFVLACSECAGADVDAAVAIADPVCGF